MHVRPAHPPHMPAHSSPPASTAHGSIQRAPGPYVCACLPRAACAQVNWWARVGCRLAVPRWRYRTSAPHRDPPAACFMLLSHGKPFELWASVFLPVLTHHNSGPDLLIKGGGWEGRGRKGNFVDIPSLHTTSRDPRRPASIPSYHLSSASMLIEEDGRVARGLKTHCPGRP
jgi:hypothetical protein